jgi:hypothetical protein
MWQFVGVILILGSGTNWVIPLIASLAFAAAVIIVPGLYEYVLSEKQKRAVGAALGKIMPGKKSRNSWVDMPSVGSQSELDTVALRDGGADKDASGLPRHRPGSANGY